jgi:hypothetical protein
MFAKLANGYFYLAFNEYGHNVNGYRAEVMRILSANFDPLYYNCFTVTSGYLGTKYAFSITD